MTTHIPAIAHALDAAVPMIRTLHLEYLETTPEHAVLRLPDQPEFHNHIGGPHAGAMFTLAESASAAIVMGAFGGAPTASVCRAGHWPTRSGLSHSWRSRRL